MERPTGVTEKGTTMIDNRPYVRRMADSFGDARRGLDDLAAEAGIEDTEMFIDWCEDRWPDENDAREYGRTVEGIDYTDPDDRAALLAEFWDD